MGTAALVVLITDHLLSPLSFTQVVGPASGEAQLPFTDPGVTVNSSSQLLDINGLPSDQARTKVRLEHACMWVGSCSTRKCVMLWGTCMACAF
jgi:hypothetical protein